MSVGIVAVSAQILVAIGALLATAEAYADGRRLLVPLTPEARAIIAPAALSRGSALIGTGPMPGSLVVVEQSQSLGWAMLSHGVIAVPAIAGGCSKGIRR